MARTAHVGDDVATKRFEINQLFTPSTPVTTAELFAGRSPQMLRIIDAIAEPGRHVLLYGERGVGKTSLAQIVPYLVPRRKASLHYYRVQAFPIDNFHSIARKIFKRIKMRADVDDVSDITAADLYKETITPDDFVHEFSFFNDNDVPIVVIDEFNEIPQDGITPRLWANAIKALSDSGTNVTLIIVGVANNVTQLIKEHESIQRCTEEIQMPRMTRDELTEVLMKRLGQLAITIEDSARWKIVNLSKGLPAYVHGLGKFAALNAVKIPRPRYRIVDDDVDFAIEGLLTSSDQTFKDAYESATRSNQPGNLLKQALTACALARTDDSGYFTPTAVREPLSAILGKWVEIANFQNHLLAFIDSKRSAILERIGEPRAYRFRFKHPAMQPYVMMRGVRDNIIHDDAKLALSSSEYPDLFAT
jgi:Cdc6-like AAA superfamily ATPase